MNYAFGIRLADCLKSVINRKNENDVVIFRPRRQDFYRRIFIVKFIK